MKNALFILGYLDDSDIDWIKRSGTLVQYEELSRLITARERITEIFLLLSGELSIRPGHNEREEVARIYPGEFIGELSFLDTRPPTESVVTATHVALVALDRAELNGKIRTDIAFAARFYRALGVLLTSRFRQTMGQLTLRPDDELEEDDLAADELDPDLLDRIAIAGHRFDMLLQHFLGK